MVAWGWKANMKKCALKRRTPLKRKGRERGKPMPALRAWIRLRPCVLHSTVPDAPHACYTIAPSECAHAPRVKAHGDVNNVIPLCHHHHMEYHRLGRAGFAAKYGLDLEELAREYTTAYLESEPTP